MAIAATTCGLLYSRWVFVVHDSKGELKVKNLYAFVLFLLIFFAVLSLVYDVGLSAAQAASMPFVASIDGSQEVPPVTTGATGAATFQLDAQGAGLQFVLTVENLADAIAAHIHCAPVGMTGPFGVTLFNGQPTTVNGILAQGTIETADANNACGWADLAAVVTAMESGDTYVNAHTIQNPGGMRMVDMDRSSKVVLGLVVGAIAGIALGLLLAPKAGRESRELIQRKSGQFWGTVLTRFGIATPVQGASEDAVSAAN